MTELNHTMPQPPAAPPAQAVPPLRKPWPVEKRERRLLPLSLALSFLLVSFLLDWMDGQWMHLPGAGVTALTAAWYGALFLYRGTAGMEKRANRALLGIVALLALTFTLFSNQWFRFWNCGALGLLIAVHTWELCGGARLPWQEAGMLLERLWLFIKGPFVCCGALLDTARSVKQGRNLSRALPAAIGVLVTVPALWLVSSVLMDADALFALVAGNVLGGLEARFGQSLARLLLAMCVMPFLFSLLYFAAHTEQPPKAEKARAGRDPLPAVMLLGALDGLYLLFLAVQSAALFGDQAYLVRAGISFAEYARSGFFQLVGLAGLNVTIILAAVWLCRDSKGLRLLSTALVALTTVLLVSAAWRMTLYVGAYGLSFKRLLTYWGMGMLSILLALTVRKVWKPEFQFFRTAAPLALAGWLLLNYANVDAIAARYNSTQVSAGRLPLSAVENLVYNNCGYDGLASCDCGLADSLWLREMAAADCGSWTTWSVSAWRAAKG